MKRLTFLLVLFASIVTIPIFFNGCAKEYSYEGGPIIIVDTTTDPTDPTDTVVVPITPPVADFTLTGTPDCTSPEINGDFKAGLAMNSSNYVAVMVDVQAIGSFQITTDTVDGIYFSAKGTFTKTGNQYVAITAIGTPFLPGRLVFHVNAGKTACSFTLTVVVQGYPATYVLESKYDSSCLDHTVIGDYTAGVVLTASNKINIRTYVTIAGVYALETNRLNGVIFSYAGEFTSTGTIYPDLKGSGTPLAKGTFTYQLHIIGPAPIGGEACTIAVTFN